MLAHGQISSRRCKERKGQEGATFSITYKECMEAMKSNKRLKLCPACFGSGIFIRALVKCNKNYAKTNKENYREKPRILYV
jgi:hypothetical protein